MAKYEEAGKSDEWYTPKYIFNALECKFETDVASPEDRSHCSVPAIKFLTKNSLEDQWLGFVWMNPPFGNQKEKFKWIEKFIKHGNGIALYPDRTSAPWFRYLSDNTDAVLFLTGKIKFIRPDGTRGESPGIGTALFAKGIEGIEGLKRGSKNNLGKLFFPYKP